MIIRKKIAYFAFFSLLLGIRLQADPFSQIRDDYYINSSIFIKDDCSHTDTCLILPIFKNFQAGVCTWWLKA